MPKVPLSPACVELLQSLCQVEPRKRWTAAESLACSWLSDEARPPRPPRPVRRETPAGSVSPCPLRTLAEVALPPKVPSSSPDEEHADPDTIPDGEERRPVRPSTE